MNVNTVKELFRKMMLNAGKSVCEMDDFRSIKFYWLCFINFEWTGRVQVAIHFVKQWKKVDLTHFANKTINTWWKNQAHQEAYRLGAVSSEKLQFLKYSSFARGIVHVKLWLFVYFDGKFQEKKNNQLSLRSTNKLIDSIYMNISNFLKIKHQNWSNYDVCC